jgi:amidase
MLASGAVGAPMRHALPAELWKWDATDLAAGVRSRHISCREATASALDRLAAVNPSVNAVVDAMIDEALTAADVADRAVKAGHALKSLHGVPITVKINVDLKGHATTNGVIARQSQIAPEDSPPVRALRESGAIIIGRTNTPTLSARWFTENPLHGRTYNPWSREADTGTTHHGERPAAEDPCRDVQRQCGFLASPRCRSGVAIGRPQSRGRRLHCRGGRIAPFC